MRRHLVALAIAAAAAAPLFAALPSPAAAIVVVDGRPVELLLACVGSPGAAEVIRASDGASLASLSCDRANPVARATIGAPEPVDWRVTLTIGDPNLRPTTCTGAVRGLPARLSCSAIGNPEDKVAFAAISNPDD